MLRNASSTMVVDGLRIGVHAPRKTSTHGRSLAPPAPVNVFDVEDYKDLPAGWPRALAPKEASFFVGVTGDNEMWFDFNALSQHSHFAAVVVTVQRVNAVTGQKADHIYLEKYVGTCPKHDINFEADRYCPECKFKWPAQNYITNAAPGTDGLFWLDGWCSQDGEIRQFVFTDVEAGLGVAQQLIGNERTEDIRFAIFLSKNPKPIPPRLEVLRRGYVEAPLVTSQMKGGGFRGEKYGSAFPIGTRAATLSAPATRGGYFSSSIGEESFDGSLESPDDFASVGTMRRIGAPVKQEVSFGRAVDQKIHADPNDIDFWQSEPAAVIMLTPAPADWVSTVTRNGATVDRTKGGMGPLAGLKGVG